jgi:hypothetical protein
MKKLPLLALIFSVATLGGSGARACKSSEFQGRRGLYRGEIVVVSYSLGRKAIILAHSSAKPTDRAFRTSDRCQRLPVVMHFRTRI